MAEPGRILLLSQFSGRTDTKIATEKSENLNQIFKWLEKSFQNSLSTDFADFADLGGKICEICEIFDDYFSKTFCTLLKTSVVSVAKIRIVLSTGEWI
ncbi:MAG: hypothetical protein R3D55_28800 [Chloroflexota bacterium]